MADEVHSLIERLQKHAPGVKGAADSAWAAVSAGTVAPESGHRALIRESLKRELGVEGLDVSPPRPADWSVSISHSRSEGGWLAVPRPARIGFDIEEIARIQPKIIARTCTLEEIAAAPNPAFLWSAKESYFKALEHEQPEAMTQLTIDHWVKIEAGTFEFHAKNLARGILITNGESTFAACLVVSN